MIRQFLGGVAACAVVLAASVLPAAADQSLVLNLGSFVPRGQDARVNGDVLNENRTFLTFDLKDFSNVTVGGEWVVGLGSHAEAGVGLSYFARTVPSVYTDYVNTDRSEIDQQINLRIIPITATVRFLPLGKRVVGVEPYIGAGVGIYRWHYSESGQFVDFRDDSVFSDRYVADGTSVGPVAMGGVRIPLGDFAFGGEVRYQAGQGTLPASQDFAGSKIDLGGLSYLATFQVRF